MYNQRDLDGEELKELTIGLRNTMTKYIKKHGKGKELNFFAAICEKPTGNLTKDKEVRHCLFTSENGVPPSQMIMIMWQAFSTLNKEQQQALLEVLTTKYNEIKNCHSREEYFGVN